MALSPPDEGVSRPAGAGRETCLCLALLIVLLACGGHTPTGPTASATPGRIFLHLQPSEGALTWQPEGSEVSLTPTLSWLAEFFAPETNWYPIVVVRLLSPGGTPCLESYTKLNSQTRRGDVLRVQGSSFHMDSSCGASFTISEVEVALKYGSMTSASQLTARLPCSYQVSASGLHRAMVSVSTAASGRANVAAGLRGRQAGASVRKHLLRHPVRRPSDRGKATPTVQRGAADATEGSNPGPREPPRQRVRAGS
jgi:hypothetical protein